MSTWKPRASKMGLYASCSRSAWLDKAIADGKLPVPEDGEIPRLLTLTLEP